MAVSELNLVPGASVEETIGPGETRSWHLRVPSALHLHLSITAAGGTLKTVLAEEATGKEISSCNSIGGTGGVAILEWTGSLAAALRLEVTSTGTDVSPRTLRVVVDEARPSVPGDNKRVDLRLAANKMLGEAQGLLVAKKYKDAFPLLDQVVQSARSIHDERLEAAALYRLGMAHYYLDERSSALSLLQQALPLQRANQQSFETALTLNNLAVIQKLIGFCHEALKEQEEALQIRQSLHNPRSVAYTLAGIAASYTCLGDAQRALDATSQTLLLWRDLKDAANEADTENTRGVIYIALGEWDNARQELESSRALWHKNGSKAGEAEAIYNLGLLEASIEHPRAARNLYTDALAYMKAAGDNRGVAYALEGLGEMDGRLGDHVHALAELQESKSKLEELGELGEEAFVWQSLADEYIRQDEKASAYTAYEKAIALATQVDDPNSRSVALYRLALLEDRDGRATSLNHVNEALSLVEATRENVLDAGHRASYLATKRGIYELKASLLMRAGDVPGALQTSESAHARSLLDEVAGNAGVDPSLVGQQQVLEDEIRLGHARTVEAQQVRLEQTIREAYPSRAAFAYPKIAELSAIQNLLGEKDLFLEFLVGDETSFVWAVTRSDLAGFPVPARKHLETLAKTLYGAVTARDQHPEGETLHGRVQRLAEAKQLAATTAAKLNTALLGRIPSRFRRDRILLVPDGPLALIPFAMLPAFDGKEVIELPSASVLNLRGAPAAPHPYAPFLILADPKMTSPAFAPLLFAKQEGTQLAALGEASSVVLRTGAHANRHALENEVSRYGLIHVSSHALLDSEHPDHSGIVLADGLFDAPSIRALSVKARLVTLSACDTAEGKEVRGEGVMSLQRAFLYAGANTVLSTLWTVDDEATSRFMQYFYTGLLSKHMNALASLLRAQKIIRQNGRWQDPYYWAAFTVEGDWR